MFSLKETLTTIASDFLLNHIHTVAHRTETLHFIGPKIWYLHPNELRETKSHAELKRIIKLWKVNKHPLSVLEHTHTHTQTPAKCAYA